jgi:hypothetical protein
MTSLWESLREANAKWYRERGWEAQEAHSRRYKMRSWLIGLGVSFGIWAAILGALWVRFGK